MTSGKAQHHGVWMGVRMRGAKEVQPGHRRVPGLGKDRGGSAVSPETAGR